MSEANLQLLILGAMLLFAWGMIKLVRWTKTKQINTELWCTVFEGLTQGAIRLDDLKAPEAVIEKKLKRDGKDRDPATELDLEIDLKPEREPVEPVINNNASGINVI